MIEAVVEEELTTRRQNTSVQITLHKHKYTMELIKTSEYFKPGLKFTAFVSVFCCKTRVKTNELKYFTVPHLFLAEARVSRRITGARYQTSRADRVRLHVQSVSVLEYFTHAGRARDDTIGFLSA